MQNRSEEQLTKSLSELLSKKRESANLSETDLAKIAKLSPHRVKALEEGKERFGLEVLSKLATAFNTTVFELITEAEDLRLSR